MWGALQIPSVQTLVVQKVTTSLSEKLRTEFRIGRVDIDFVKTIVLEDVYLEDQKQDTLLYAAELRADIGVVSLLNKTVNLNLIGLENAVINVTKAPGDTAFNFAFIPEAFAPADTTTDTTASAWDIDLSEVDFQNIRLTYADAEAGNELKMRLARLGVDVETLGLTDKYPKINALTIDGLNVAFAQPQPEADTLAQLAAETTKLDTLASSVQRAASDSAAAQPQDSVEMPFNSSGYRLALGAFFITNTNLQYDVKGAPVAAQGMDFSHLSVQDLLLKITGVQVGPNNFAAEVENFAFREKSGFTLKQLALAFKADMPAVQADVHTLQTANSVVDNGVQVRIASISDVANLVRNLELDATFKDDSLSMRDAQYFTTALDSFPALQNQHVFLDGRLHVDGENAQATDLTAGINPENQLSLNADVQNLYNLAETRADIRIAPLKTSAGFIEGFVPAGTLPPEFKQAGELTLTAQVKGYLRDLTGDLQLQTSAGRLTADFTGGTDTSFANNQIDARIIVNELDLAKFLGKASQLGNVSLTANVKGSRSGEEIAVPQAEVNLKNLTYNQYTYQNIQLQGSYLKDVAKAVLQANDRNLQASINAAANLQGKEPVISVNGDIAEVDLRRLNFITDTLTFRTRLNADITGTDPDQLVGKISLNNISVQKPAATYKLDSLNLALLNQNGNRIVDLNSEILDARAEGQFTLAELPLAIDLFVKKYFTTFPVTSKSLKQQQSVNFQFSVAQNPALIEGLVSGLDIPQSINFKGSFASIDNQLNLDGKIPKLIFGSQQVTDFNLSAHTSEDKLNLDVQAAQVQVTDSFAIPEPKLHASLDEDNLQFNINLAAPEADSRLALNGRFQAKGDTFMVSLDPSELYLKKNSWELKEESRLVYAPEYVLIENFELSQKNQRIAINGSSKESLNVALANLSIAELMELLPPMGYTIGGTINGEAQVAELFQIPLLQADLNVDTLKVDQYAIGHVELQADRNRDGGVGAQLTVNGPGNDIDVQGAYYPDRETDNLSADITISQITLEQFGAFVKESVTEMRGNLTADLQVRGSLDAPTVNGALVFDSTLVRPALLGVPFTITNQRIQFQNQQVVFNQFTLADEEKRTATINGQVNYADIASIQTDLRFRTEGFQFVNTRTGDTFYGRAFASTNLHLYGPADNLVLNGRVQTLPNTELFLPVYDVGGSQVEQADYITFIGKNNPPPNDAQTQETAQEGVATSGFSMNVRATVTPDAIVNILLDDRSKDNIRAVGGGAFDIRNTPQGDFLVNGVYEITEGSYLLSLLGAIKKEFAIRKGSTITLNGPPDEAQLDITAVYETETSLEEFGANTQAIVQVLTKIKGDLEELDISFEIDVPNTGDNVDVANAQIKDYLEGLRNNPGETNKQAFALITLNRLLPPDNNIFEGGGGGNVYAAADKSISQLLTNQLGALSENYLGVELSVDVESSDDANSSFADKDVGINLSKEFFNDRLSVTVGSTVGLGTTNTSSGSGAPANNSGSLIGDFILDYKLIESGNLNLRFFRRQDNNVLNANRQDRIGFSFLHRKNFNYWKNVFNFREERRRKRQKAPVPAEEQ